MQGKFLNKATDKDLWKRTTFTLGTIMIIGAISYTVLIRHADSAVNPSDTVLALAVANSSNSIPTLNGIGELEWVKNLSVVNYGLMELSRRSNNEREGL